MTFGVLSNTLIGSIARYNEYTRISSTQLIVHIEHAKPKRRRMSSVRSRIGIIRSGSSSSHRRVVTGVVDTPRDESLADVVFVRWRVLNQSLELTHRFIRRHRDSAHCLALIARH